MKTMRIGSSIINLDSFISIESRDCEDGVIVTIEHENSIKEYLAPDFHDPEFVAAAIHIGIRESESFDLIPKLHALERIYGG